MFASPVLSLHTKQIAELNACSNNVIRIIFGYQRWESVNAVGLMLPINFFVRKVKFYKRLFFKSGSMHNIFWAAL